jgi:hypothetical protein
MDDEEKGKLALTLAADARKSEIGLLWSRSLYFWGFITVALASYGGAINSSRYTFAFFAACVGFILSLCWTLANRSGKYWQAVWEWTTDKYSEDLFQNNLFTTYHVASVNTDNWWGPKRYSPSKLAMAVSDLIVAVWIALAFAAIIDEPKSSSIILDVCLAAATLLYAAHILRACRSGNPPDWAKVWSNAKARLSAWRRRPNDADFL